MLVLLILVVFQLYSLSFILYTSTGELEVEERKHVGFSKTGMLPLVLETSNFSKDNIYSMENHEKPVVFLKSFKT